MIDSLSRAQTLIFVCVCGIVPVGSCLAQNIDRVQSRTVDAVRDQTPGIARGDTPQAAAEDDGSKPAPKMQGDDEFGEQMILARRAHVEPWTTGVDAQYFYTDNVALTPHGALHDTYLRTGVYAQYANRIVGDWFMDATVSSFFFLHDKYNFSTSTCCGRKLA